MLKSATLAVPGALALSALGGFNQAAPAQAATGQWWNDPGLIPPASQTFFSVFISDDRADKAQLKKDIEATMGGRKLRATNVYWNDGDVESPNSGLKRAQAALNDGMIPRLDWCLNRAVFEAGWRDLTNINGKSLWRAVADGDFDNDRTLPNATIPGLRTVFRKIAAFDTSQFPAANQKIFFSMFHEPELRGEGGGVQKQVGTVKYDTSCGTELEFQAAWRHAYAVSKEENAPILWVLSLAANPNSKWGTNLTATGSDGLYPGHNYVDWIGWDPYNRYRFFNSDGTQTQDWFDLMKLITRKIDANPSLIDWWYTHFSVQGSTSGLPYKPVMLCETGTSDIIDGLPPKSVRSNEVGLMNGKEWMLGLRWALANSPRPGITTLSQVIRGVIYFSKSYTSEERPTNVDWSIDENRGSPTSKWAALSQLSPQGDWLFNW